MTQTLATSHIETWMYVFLAESSAEITLMLHFHSVVRHQVNSPYLDCVLS